MPGDAPTPWLIAAAPLRPSSGPPRSTHAGSSIPRPEVAHSVVVARHARHDVGRNPCGRAIARDRVCVSRA
eukprot:5501139-Prymnesium_polylepis.1